MIANAAIYARYSSDNQKPSSIEDQVRLCRRRVEQEGWTLAEVYSDPEISGFTVANRPGIRALLADARAGRFDVLVVEALDRISRGQADTLRLYEELTFLEISIVSLSRGRVDELQAGFDGMMNARFLKDLAAKVRRGQIGRASAGKAPGGLSYGYRVVKRLDEAGEPVRGEREIDPGQAAVVREIFRRVAAGDSVHAIVQDLNARGVPAPGAGSKRGGKAWRVSTVNGHAARRNGILHNPLYRGRLVYNRVRMVKDPESGRRISRVNDAAELVETEVPELRIVDEALWQAAQAQRRQVARQPLPRRRRAKRLLSGLLFCGCCGSSLAIIDRGAYGCTGHRDSGTCGNGRRIPAAEAEARILAVLKGEMLTPENVGIFVAEFQRERRRLQQQAAQSRRRETRKLADLAARIDRTVKAIGEGLDTPAMRRELVELEGEKARLEALQAAQEARGDAKVEKLAPDLARQYRDTVARLQEVLAGSDSAAPAEELRAVRSLIDKVVVTPGPHRRAPCELELHGSLATLLEGITHPKTAGERRRNAGDLRGLSVVAGEGFGHRPPSWIRAA